MVIKKNLNNEKSEKAKEAMDRFCNNLVTISKLCGAVSRELWIAGKTRTLPVTTCLLFTIGFCIIRLFRVDERIYAAWGWGPFFLKGNIIFWAYHIFWLTLSFVVYGVIRTGRTVVITHKLKKVCQGIGLTNSFGETPAFVSDHPVDESNRILRLDRKFIPEEEFVKKQKSIGGALQVHIDSIEEIREDGTISIYYSPVEMPALYLMPDIKKYKDFTFPIGKSRSRELTGDFKKNPHMLVAGATDGGKSTFLRQLITTLYLNNDNAEFVLIDLKGNLEFQFFEGLPRMTVCSEVSTAITELKTFHDKIENRFSEIKSISAKDFDDYQRIRNQKLASKIEHIVVPKQISRVMIIIDEASDLFGVTDKVKSFEVRVAKEILNQLSRKGRALGFHLVFSTQRPDVTAITSQMKSNLESILAYKIANDASSKTMLDSGRASHLPKIPGRAIWKMGGEMTEVQTPFLDVPQLEKLLDPLKLKKPASPPEPVSKPAGTTVVVETEGRPTEDLSRTENDNVSEGAGQS